jgi:SagB-type dehydrogenase family enzyme
VVPLSSSEVEYPEVPEAYARSALDSSDEVSGWRESGSPARPPAPHGQSLVRLPDPPRRAGRGLGETILTRGSARRFSHAPLDAGALSAVLFHATCPWPADVPQGLVELALTVHAVDGLAPGAYVYRSHEHALARLRTGDFRREAAFLCLEQALGGAASATVFFLADLGNLLGRYGNRGYRLANLEAGLVGGRLYLAAYAGGFAATGLTYYDDAVVAFFSPHAAGKDAIFVTALGHAASRPSR